MAARLKLFAARMGFFDTVVAAPSQAAALRAWGVNQDLFKEGFARVTNDADAATALAQPGVVLRRSAGSSDPYTAEAAVRDDLAPQPRRAKTAVRSPKPPPPKPPPDRTALDRAEAALAEARRTTASARDDLARRRTLLDEEVDRLERETITLERRLQAAADAARTAFRRTGGHD